jgi:hypothetical protein
MLRNKIIYLCMLLCVLFVLIMYPDLYIAIVLRVMVVMPVISGLLFYVPVRKMTFSMKMTTDYVEKQEKRGIPLTISVENNSMIPLFSGEVKLHCENLYDDRGWTKRLALGAPARDHTTITYYLETEHVGIITAHCDKIVCYDFLRLWKRKIEVAFEHEIIVLPEAVGTGKALDVKQLSRGYETEEYAKNKAGDDSTEVFGIREYKPGDRLRQIHWKLSCKLDRYMIKEGSQPLLYRPLVYVEPAIPIDEIFYNNQSVWHRWIDLFYGQVMELLTAMVENGLQLEAGSYESQQACCYRCLVEKAEDVAEALGVLMHTSLQLDAFGLEEYLNYDGGCNVQSIFYVTPEWTEDVLSQLAVLQGKMPVYVIWMQSCTQTEKAQINRFYRLLEQYGLEGSTWEDCVRTTL